MLGEIVDLDDIRVVYPDEEPSFGHRGRHRVRITGVDQSLEDDPPIGPRVADVLVPGQIYPAETAMGDGTEDLVPVVHEFARGEAGPEREGGAVLRAEADDQAGLPRPFPAD